MIELCTYILTSNLFKEGYHVDPRIKIVSLLSYSIVGVYLEDLPQEPQL